MSRTKDDRNQPGVRQRPPSHTIPRQTAHIPRPTRLAYTARPRLRLRLALRASPRLPPAGRRPAHRLRSLLEMRGPVTELPVASRRPRHEAGPRSIAYAGGQAVNCGETRVPGIRQ